MKISKKTARGGNKTPRNANESQHSHHLDRRIPTFPKQSHRLVQSCIAFTSACGVWKLDKNMIEFENCANVNHVEVCSLTYSSKALKKNILRNITSPNRDTPTTSSRLGGPHVFTHPTGKCWYLYHYLGGAQLARPHPNQTKTNHSETRPQRFNSFKPIDSQPAEWQHKIPDNKVERTPMALPASVPARVVSGKKNAKTNKIPWSMGHLPVLFLEKFMEVENENGYTWKVTAIEGTNFFTSIWEEGYPEIPINKKQWLLSQQFLLDPNEGDELKLCWIHQQWDYSISSIKTHTIHGTGMFTYIYHTNRPKCG